jgi:hypothetical protein
LNLSFTTKYSQLKRRFCNSKRHLAVILLRVGIYRFDTLLLFLFGY